MDRFRDRIWGFARKKGSRLILALDLEQDSRNGNHDQLFARALALVDELGGELCGVKLSFQLFFRIPVVDRLAQLARRAHQQQCAVIADLKLNDVGHTNQFVARCLFDAGFDAIIANPITGWSNGLQSVFELARSHSAGVLCLCHPSHEGAREFYNLPISGDGGADMRLYELFALKAVSWGADGLVVGATYPELVRQVSDLIKDAVPIYSPGVGVQGGDVCAAFHAGATFAIVGRSVHAAEDPLMTVESLNRRINESLGRQRE